MMADMELTPSQSAAVWKRGESILVSAGAGSGKTRVLVERLMGYLTDGDCGRDIDDFLIITYTRAAAAELRGRILAALSEKIAREPENRRLRKQSILCHRAKIGTIHSFCADILRENPQAAGMPHGFRVVEEEGLALIRERVLERVLDEAYDNIRENAGFRALVDTLGAGRDDSRLAAMVLELNDKMGSHPYPRDWAMSQISAMRRALETGPAETVWARALIERAEESARFWAGCLQQFALELKSFGEPGAKVAKSYGPSLLETEAALRDLQRRAAGGDWEAVRQALPVPFPAFKKLVGEESRGLGEKAKYLRDGCKIDMSAICEDFSGGQDALAREFALTLPSGIALLELGLCFDARYAAEKKSRSLAGFSDLEHGALALLMDRETGLGTPLAREYSQRFAEIMVDEYQDCSAVQDAIFTAVSDGGEKLFAVGDIKQSIYRFRLADPGIFSRKYKAFRSCGDDSPGRGLRIPLQENFRSRPEIIAAVNGIFGCLMSPELGEINYDEEARLLPAADYPEGAGKAEMHIVRLPESDTEGELPDSEETEAYFVACRILELMKSGTRVYDKGVLRPLSYGDIVILLRSVKTAGDIFGRVLALHGIPVSAERSGGFFESAEICTMISFLEIIDNPRQDIPLISVLRSPLFLFTADELAAVRMHEPKADFFTALTKAAEHIKKCADFLEELNKLREDSRDMGVARLIWRIYVQMRLFARLSAMDGGAEKRQNIIRLAECAEEFESSGYRGINAFISHLEKIKEHGREPGRPETESGSAVSIMTIHKSKGLEFPVVFLSGAAKAFNREDAKGAMLIHARLGLGQKVTDTGRGIEYPGAAHRAVSYRITREALSEELRILYVAMTRARERLIVTCAWKKPEKKLAKLSPGVSFPIPAPLLVQARSYAEWLYLAASAEENEGLFSIYVQDTPRKLPTRMLQKGEESAKEQSSGVREGALVRLGFVYPHLSSCTMPSKMTATEMKGIMPEEDLDDETAGLIPPGAGIFRLPDFNLKNRPLSGAERGTAAHLVMQHIDFSKTGSAGEIEGEIIRLQNGGILTERQAGAVRPEYIAGFFESPLGRRLKTAERVWRELRFSLLWPSETLVPDARGDEVLMQGVLDCCFEENGALTLIDFKTDYVENNSLEERARYYRGQLAVYASALERMTKYPLKLACLYFLRLSRYVEITI